MTHAVPTTFLELAQDLRTECGISGDDGTPVSVSGQTGELKRVVDWIQDAYQEVQGLHVDWDFLRAEFTFNTLIGTTNYPPSAVNLDNHAFWKVDTFSCYTTATGTADEQYLYFVPWDDFRDRYLFGPTRDTSDRPIYFTVKPDKSLSFWPKPDAVYTIAGEHWIEPATLASNDEEPLFPVRFRRILTFKGMMFYGAFEGAAEVYANGERQYNTMLGGLESDQLPAIGVAGALA